MGEKWNISATLHKNLTNETQEEQLDKTIIFCYYIGERYTVYRYTEERYKGW